MKQPPLLRAMRPLQWVKNLVIAGPLVFVPKAWAESAAWGRTAETICAFCLLAGGTYLLNDLMDRAADQHHPTKRNRPIASGELGVQTALVAWILSTIAGLGWLWQIEQRPSLPFAETQVHWLLWSGVAYLVLTLAYSLWLKRIPILDVILVALGFVIRAVAGGAVLQVHVSPWLLLCTFLLLLMVALGKRRWEMESLEDAHAHRPILAEYNLALIDQFLSITAAMTLMAYSLYTFNTSTIHGPWLMLTIPNVLYGVVRYLALIHIEGSGGAPEEAILKDAPTLINIGVWILLSAAILRLAHG